MQKIRVALVGLAPDSSTALCRSLDPRRFAVDQFPTPVAFLHVLGNLRSAQPTWTPAYDVVVCRIDMPGISGVALLHQTRLADPSILVVITCPSLDEELAADLQALGASAVAGDPIEPSHFRELLERVLTTRPASRPGTVD